MIRLFFAVVTCTLFLGLSDSGFAQGTEDAPTRAETGGAQTLEDILRRQRGEEVDPDFRKDAVGDPDSAAWASDPLGTRGFASDPELWRALRYGQADVTSQVKTPGANLLVQDGGMAWLQFREGPLSKYGTYFLVGVIILLALFYLIRGRIRIDAGPSEDTIRRFTPIERFAHWLLAGSFILLAFTGLITLFGRKGLIPFIGHDAYSTIAVASKWVHNNVSWAFMLGLVLVFVFWVIHNLPSRTDLVWLAKGGGFIGKRHPPAKKFNAGQKLIFWAVILLGGSISLSAFRFYSPSKCPVAPSFAKLNALGVPGWFGADPLPEVLAPHAEMQLSQLWHAIVSFILMGIILAHIYIGSLGMEGAYDAMGSGDVDLNWAKEHHSLWVDEVQSKKSDALETATAG